MYRHELRFVLRFGVREQFKEFARYARWAAFYDEPGNELIAIEQPCGVH